jgi:hypothetical protein
MRQKPSTTGPTFQNGLIMWSSIRGRGQRGSRALLGDRSYID